MQTAKLKAERSDLQHSLATARGDAAAVRDAETKLSQRVLQLERIQKDAEAGRYLSVKVMSLSRSMSVHMNVRVDMYRLSRRTVSHLTTCRPLSCCLSVSASVLSLKHAQTASGRRIGELG